MIPTNRTLRSLGFLFSGTALLLLLKKKEITAVWLLWLAVEYVCAVSASLSQH